jgi:hypothetical protein
LDIEDNGACFIIRDNKGQALSHVFYENEPGRLRRYQGNSIGRVP